METILGILLSVIIVMLYMRITSHHYEENLHVLTRNIILICLALAILTYLFI